MTDKHCLLCPKAADWVAGWSTYDTHFCFKSEQWCSFFHVCHVVLHLHLAIWDKSNTSRKWLNLLIFKQYQTWDSFSSRPDPIINNPQEQSQNKLHTLINYSEDMLHKYFCKSGCILAILLYMHFTQELYYVYHEIFTLQRAHAHTHTHTHTHTYMDTHPLHTHPTHTHKRWYSVSMCVHTNTHTSIQR